MIRARFIGGHYDGAEFTFAERMPDRVIFEVKCHDIDTEDPAFREAFFANLEGEPTLGQTVFCRNATARYEKYVFNEDEQGTPFFRFAGWSVDGVSSGDT